MNKVCKKCGKELSIDNFYAHYEMLDGHLNICKECTKKRVSKHRINNIEKVRLYDRKRGKTEDRLNKNKIRSRNVLKYKKKDYLNKYNNKYPEKYIAHNMINNLLRDGKIKKSIKCEFCGKDDCVIEGHHFDYNKPNEVIWLCHKCHMKLHRIYYDN
jgi:ribosome-binding protein aMBF1 (putative translation factor)